VASKLFAWLALLLTLPACASTTFHERELWNQAAKEEETLDKAGQPYGDPLLEEYLARVAARVAPAQMIASAPPIRVSVVGDPTLNAFAMPDGRVYLHTGLLARLENEAQLAAILAHELTHVTHRAALGLDARVPESVSAAPAVFRGLPLASRAAVRGYGRALERDADVQGLRRMVEAGYDPGQAPRAFELLQRRYGDSGALEPFFFGNRSQLEERARNARELLQARYAGLDPRSLNRNGNEFAARTRVLVRENAALDVRAGRFELARAQLDHVLALMPTDAAAYVVYGDLHRLQAQRPGRAADAGRLRTLARQAYERAAGLDPTYADPFRQLGLLYYESGDRADAQVAFRKYLALDPDAVDARRIHEYVVELAR